MSEQMSEQAGDGGAIDAALGKIGDAPAAASAAEAEPRLIAPDHEAPRHEITDEPTMEAPEPAKAEAGPEAPAVEAPQPEPRAAGKLLVMSPGERAWHGEAPGASHEAETATGRRRWSAMAAVIALAAMVGAVSGALATASVMHFAARDGSAGKAEDLEASIARIDADVSSLKANLDHSSKVALGQYSKANDRLDRLEKAQAEPAAKLAKLSETVDKLRTGQASAPPAAAPKETTGSVTPAPAAVASATPAPVPAAPKSEVGRLPTVEGWVLRDVGHGGALIEGRQGLYEVYAGDPVPGLGRVDAIRRQDGRWVVVTSKGLIVAR